MKYQMRQKIFISFALLIIEVLSGCFINLSAQGVRDTSTPSKVIAVTIDDLPLNGPRIEHSRLQQMTDKLLAGIKQYQMPVIGFVNESLLYVPGETDARIGLLKNWADAGVELGNHTFSHMGFKDAPLSAFEDDFIRGDAITGRLMKERGQRVRYFRHPFLQMGSTPELEKSFEQFIAARGYQIAPVTIDTMDWMFLSAYGKARAKGDAAGLKRVSDEYLKYAGLKLDFCAQAANDLFGRPIKHILLLHANELNADNFDGLVKVFSDRGYRFIALEEALKDAVYQFPDNYQPTSDWLSHWSFSKAKRFAPPSPPEFIQKAFAEN